MNIFEAFEAIDNGFCVRRKGGYLVYFKIISIHINNDKIYCVNKDSYDDVSFDLSTRGCIFTREDIKATDWEVYHRSAEQ